MKVVRLLANGLLIAAIFGSVNYWFSRFSKPAALPQPDISRQAQPSLDVTAARHLFGKRVETPTRRNYQLNGVIFSGAMADRMAIISIEGKPATVVRLGGQLQEGVTLTEVNPSNVMLSVDHGDLRIYFPQTAQASVDNYAWAENLPPVPGADIAPAVNQGRESAGAEAPGTSTRPAPWGLSRPDPGRGLPAAIRAAPPER